MVGPSAPRSDSICCTVISSSIIGTRCRLRMGRAAHLPFEKGPARLVRVRARAAVVALVAALLAPAAAGASLRDSLEHALRVPHVSLASTGAVAVDLTTGETVYSRNGSLPLIPASNEK